MNVRVWHHNEITTLETKKIRLILEDGRIIGVDTDERLFQEVTMIEFGS